MRMEPAMAKIPKKPKNLSLDPATIERGERYAKRHGTSLSGLVSDYLSALPLDPPAELHSPAVRRLYGVAAGGAGSVSPDRKDYREYLARKYGVA
jgi:hypothetical protein